MPRQAKAARSITDKAGASPTAKPGISRLGPSKAQKKAGTKRSAGTHESGPAIGEYLIQRLQAVRHQRFARSCVKTLPTSILICATV